LFQVLYSRRQEIIALGCGAGQPNISQQIIKNLDLVLPPLPEQRKIAVQIAAIDKVLNDCTKQLHKAENLKQGMMSYFFG
jgi:type I restriction enzyme S subunit